MTSKITKKNQLTPFQQELLDVGKKINEFKITAEANVVSIIYKTPDLLRESNLKLEEFSNNCWKVYFSIANELIMVEKKMDLNDTTIAFYLEKHPKLADKYYNEYGGYETIASLQTYATESNFDGYLTDLRKYNALMKLAQRGFPITEDKLKSYVSMTAEDIYSEYTVYLNDTFVNLNNDIQTYNGFDGLYDLINEADTGINVGLPFYNAPLLTKEIGGFNLNGNLYGLGAGSGCGKTTIAIQYLFPSVLFNKERACFIINEQDQQNFRKEALLWVCSNILKKPIPKHIFRDGHFSQEVKDTLYEAANWLDEKKEDRTITIIPLERYSARTVCKIIRKFSQPPFSISIFCLDTLKESVDTMGVDTWKSLERDVRDIYDTCKPTACNVGCLLTYQLSKSSLKTRHLTNSDIGQGKSIVDTMACNLLMTRMEEREYTGESKDLHVFKLEGKNGKSKIQVKTDKDKYYMITFVAKNRFGETDTKAIVSEVDFSLCTNHDVGYAIVPTDW